MLTATEYKWIFQAMKTLNAGEVTEMNAAKTYRIIGQLFEGAAQRVELVFISKIEEQLSNIET
jgi:hypothetical protein